MHFMNTLDLLIIAVLAGGMIRGVSTGVIRQVAGFVGFILAIILSAKLMDPVGGLVAASLGLSPRIAPVAGFVVVFLAIEVGLFVLIRTVEAIVGALRLSALNRVLGGALGVLKAALFLSILFLFLGYLDVPAGDTKAESALYRPVATVLPQAWDAVGDLLPELRRLAEGAAGAGDRRAPEAAE